MPDYQKGKIYKIYSVSNKELVYYGSTIQPLNVRLSGHIRDYKNNKNNSSKLVLDAGDYKIELVEVYPCENKQQLNKKEAEYIRNNVCVNKNIPDRTQKEYREDNKEKLAEIMKDYYENNKEKIQEYKKKWGEKNKEAIAEKKKEWYENNKEYKKDYDKVYREKNKEAISERKNKKITCECGCIISTSNLASHKKTNKHLELIQ